MMDYLLLIISILCILIGIIGCILPVIPGIPISYAGLLILHFTPFAEYKIMTLVWLGIMTVLVLILDYVVPVWGTKKFGGSKYGAWGSAIGLVVGMFFIPAIGPFGIITILAGPFFGALIGEKIAGQNTHTAMRAAFGSFIGFLAGTFIKIAASLVIAGFFVSEIINYMKK
jgi:uncharacterized protein